MPSIRVGVDCDEGPPVPIPNTEVKLICADNTWRATAREVLSAQMSLTSVFGMGTGGPSSQSTRTLIDGF